MDYISDTNQMFGEKGLEAGHNLEEKNKQLKDTIIFIIQHFASQSRSSLNKRIDQEFLALKQKLLELNLAENTKPDCKRKACSN